TRKFMQTLDSKLYSELEKVARKRGITVQQLLRAVIVPDWFRDENPEKSREISRRGLYRRLRTRRLAARVSA
ncbi:MAG TPA: hypothetical protein VIH34_03505, partial [Candidatus Bathyarchaeia archaeon]